MLVATNLLGKLFAVAAVASVAAAGLIGHEGTGTSVTSRSEDGLGNYKFAYNEKHASGGSFRSESGGKLGVAGSYGLVDADGRSRVVNYVADALGFRASIKTNEPGTAPAAAAATSIAAPGGVSAAKVAPAALSVVPAAAHVAPYVAASPLYAARPVIAGYAPAAAAYGSVGYGHY